MGRGFSLVIAGNTAQRLLSNAVVGGSRTSGEQKSCLETQKSVCLEDEGRR